MIVEADITINGTRDTIWSVITDFQNAATTINAIDKIEILEQPDNGVDGGLVGLRWRETRTLFGKTATEQMQITDATQNEFYKTRAQSHGFVYRSTVRLSDPTDHEGGRNGTTSLTMTHVSEPQSLLAKLMSLPMGLVFKGAMKKCLVKDLEDIKAAVEQRS